MAVRASATPPEGNRAPVGSQGCTDHLSVVPVLHAGGVPWYAAPRPRRIHRCRAHTVGWLPGTGYVSRCRCGATLIAQIWSGKNSRKA